MNTGSWDRLDQGQFSVPDYDAATSFLRDRPRTLFASPWSAASSTIALPSFEATVLATWMMPLAHCVGEPSPATPAGVSSLDPPSFTAWKVVPEGVGAVASRLS